MARFTPHESELAKLSNDSTHEKFITHLVYMTSSGDERFVEKKIIDSIFVGKPKRADIYWFVHIEITDEPYTMDYKVNSVMQDDIIWVTFYVGFRVELRVDYFFRFVLANLIKNKEIDLGKAADYQKMIGEKALGDFKFVILESFLSNASELKWYDDLMMESYFSIKKVSSTAEDWFGLDPSSVVVEQVPMIISPMKELALRRVF